MAPRGADLTHVHVGLAAGGLVRLPAFHVAVVICVFVSFLLLRYSMILPFAKHEKDQIGSACNKHEREQKNIQNFD